MADILCKLKLTTDEYESNLRKSKQQMRDFENSIGIAKSSVTKFLGVLGASVTVGEAFNKSIRSSQTLSDEYDRTIRGVTGTVDNLFYSIAIGVLFYKVWPIRYHWREKHITRWINWVTLK